MSILKGTWKEKIQGKTPLTKYIVIIVIIFLPLLLFLITHYPVETDPFKYRIDLGVKIIAGIVAFGIALWRWQPVKDKAEEDVYLQAVTTLTDVKTQAAYTGASYQLLHLAKRNKKYVKPGTLIIENAIREISEKTYQEWLEGISVDNSGKLIYPGDKKISPAIKTMVAIVLKIRDLKCEDHLPNIDFRRADLRGLNSGDFKDIENYQDQLLNANFRNADLRGVDLDLSTSKLEGDLSIPSMLDGAWIGMTNSKYHGNATKINLSIKLEKNLEISLTPDFNEIKRLVEKGARLFLTGSWSSSVFENQKDLFQFGEGDKTCKIAGGPGVNFDGMNLKKCDFSNAYLAGASFRNTDLKGAIFSAADIRGADFTGAKLTGCSDKEEKIPDATFDSAIFKNTIFKFNDEIKKVNTDDDLVTFLKIIKSSNQ
jgi:uncharacterized protein YjbI with pentapeptide repeats